MTHNIDSRKQAWQPPSRPEWVRKVNQEGDHMDLKSVVPLDENSLLNCAKANTGLNDFGVEHWYEPFKVLIRAYDEDSQLNLMGRLLTRAELLSFLEARLQIEEAYKQNPQIDEQEITKPLLIMGQGRTGTSALQNLLAEDPDNRTLRTWEVYYPYPAPEKETYRTDPRIEKADNFVTIQNRVTPELESMHEFNGWIPTESLQLQCMSFIAPSWFNLLGQVPSYNEYIATQDFRHCYQYEKRVLKFLQWKNFAKTWVLKTPDYIGHMPEVLDVYPDACLAWIHRDPIKAMASATNLLGTYMWTRSDYPFNSDAYEYVTSPEFAAQYMSQPITWLEDGVVAKNQLCNIQYSDFIKAPIASIQEIYNFFGLERGQNSFEVMQNHIDQNPRNKRPKHHYDAGNQEQVKKERAVFRQYQDYFNVPNEI